MRDYVGDGRTVRCKGCGVCVCVLCSVLSIKSLKHSDDSMNHMLQH